MQFSDSDSPTPGPLPAPPGGFRPAGPGGAMGHHPGGPGGAMGHHPGGPGGAMGHHPGGPGPGPHAAGQMGHGAMPCPGPGGPGAPGAPGAMPPRPGMGGMGRGMHPPQGGAANMGRPLDTPVTKTYHGWSFRRDVEAVGEEATWKRTRRNPLPFSNDELARMVKKANGGGGKKGKLQPLSVSEQYRALRSRYQRAAVDQLIEEQTRKETNRGAEWVLACIETDVREVVKRGMGFLRETTELRVVLTRQQKAGAAAAVRCASGAVTTDGLPGKLIDFDNPVCDDGPTRPAAHMPLPPPPPSVAPGPPMGVQRPGPSQQHGHVPQQQAHMQPGPQSGGHQLPQNRAGSAGLGGQPRHVPQQQAHIPHQQGPQSGGHQLPQNPGGGAGFGGKMPPVPPMHHNLVDVPRPQSRGAGHGTHQHPRVGHPVQQKQRPQTPVQVINVDSDGFDYDNDDDYEEIRVMQDRPKGPLHMPKPKKKKTKTAEEPELRPHPSINNINIINPAPEIREKRADKRADQRHRRKREVWSSSSEEDFMMSGGRSHGSNVSDDWTDDYSTPASSISSLSERRGARGIWDRHARVIRDLREHEKPRPIMKGADAFHRRDDRRLREEEDEYYRDGGYSVVPGVDYRRGRVPLVDDRDYRYPPGPQRSHPRAVYGRSRSRSRTRLIPPPVPELGAFEMPWARRRRHEEAAHRMAQMEEERIKRDWVAEVEARAREKVLRSLDGIGGGRRRGGEFYGGRYRG